MRSKVMVVILILTIAVPVIAQWKTPKKARKHMEYVLKNEGFNVEVTVTQRRDVSEFWFEVQKWFNGIRNKSSSEKTRLLGMLYGAIVGAVGTVTENAEWEADAAWITVKGKRICWFYTRDCRKALKIPKSEVPEFIKKIRHLVKN